MISDSESEAQTESDTEFMAGARKVCNLETSHLRWQIHSLISYSSQQLCQEEEHRPVKSLSSSLLSSPNGRAGMLDSLLSDLLPPHDTVPIQTHHHLNI